MSPTVVRLRKILLWAILSVVVLALLVLGTASLILATAGGSRWALAQVFDRVSQLPDTTLTVEGMEGTLLRGLSIRNLHFNNANVSLDIAQAAASWNPYTLLSGNFYSPGLSVSDAQLEIKPAVEPRSDPQPGLSIALPALPIAIDIQELLIQNTVIRQGTQSFELQNLSTGLRLNGQNLMLTGLELQFDPLRLDGDIEATLAGQLPLVADLNWQYRGLAAPLDNLGGHLNATGDLLQLEVQNQLTTPASIASDGTLRTGLDGQPLRLELTHRTDSLTLPYAQLQEVLFEEVTLVTSGELSALRLELVTAVTSSYAPPLSLATQALLTTQQLSFESLQIETATGIVSADAFLGWQDNLHGAVNFQLREEAPMSYLEASLPMALAAVQSRGSLRFSLPDNSLQGTLQLDELTGNFGDYPFTGSGLVELQGSTYRFEEMQLATASNRLQFSGTLGENLAFDWSLTAPEINQFIADLSGDVSANGTLAGSPDDPDITATLQADDLSYGEFQIANLNADLRRLAGHMEGAITIQDALVAGQSLQSLDLRVVGTDTNHTLSLQGSAEQGSATLSVQGGFTDFPSLNWRGSLQAGGIQSPAGAWSTASSTTLAYVDNNLELEESCWQQGQSTLCISAAGNTAGGADPLVARATLSNYPLAVFNHPDLRPPGLIADLPALPFLPQSVMLEGVTRATVAVSLAANNTPRVDLDVEPENLGLRIFSSSDEETGADDQDAATDTSRFYELGATRITGSFDNDTWRFQASTRVLRETSNLGSFDLEGVIETNVMIEPGGRLDGNLQANLDNIGWISALVPDLTGVQGQLEGDLTLSGTLEAPRLASDLHLTGGQFGVTPLGITVTDTRIRVISPDSESLELTVEATSGAGQLQIEGRLDKPFTAERSLTGSVTGSAFELADNEELRATVSPQVQIAANRERINFQGRLLIPLLALKLTTLPETAVDVSRDAVVVDYPPDQPELSRSIAAEQGMLFNIPVEADLEIVLGDEISFEGFGLTTNLAGNLDVQQHANGTNLTYGTLEILNGSFEMYGQSLQINQGELLFFGAYDNPALDIRATREFEGTTAGVLMNGTLKNINSQLFSTPALPDSDIIAILATGKPFSEVGEQDSNAMLGAIASLGLNRSQGLTNQVRDRLGLDTLAITNTGNINNAALTIGKYLTPDLFIRYGVGLFDRQSKLALDYTLTERITLQAESGEYQSVDVIYKVER